MSLTLESVVEQPGQAAHRRFRRRNPQGHHHRRAHGRPRQLRRHHLADSARPVRGQRRATTPLDAESIDAALRQGAATWRSRPCASRWRAPSSPCCAIPPPLPSGARKKKLVAGRGAGRTSWRKPTPRCSARPSLLPVLKENGVVDAGGYGLAILFDAFAAALTGQGRPACRRAGIRARRRPEGGDRADQRLGRLANTRYCNEFLVDSDTLDKNEALDFLSTMGDCELCVGERPKFKVHVHSNTPDKVLTYFLERGQISEVFIHNMKLQSEERTGKAGGREQPPSTSRWALWPWPPVRATRRSSNRLGVDVVVSGGQTMNPSTKDLLDAAAKVNADAVIFLPNNKNIIMAAQSACRAGRKALRASSPRSPCRRPSPPCSAWTPTQRLRNNVEAMTEAFEDVKTRRGHHGHQGLEGRQRQPHRRRRRHRHRRRLHRRRGRKRVRRGYGRCLSTMEAEDCRHAARMLAGEDLSDEDFQAAAWRASKRPTKTWRSTRTAAASRCTPSSSPWNRGARWPIGSQLPLH